MQVFNHEIFLMGKGRDNRQLSVYRADSAVILHFEEYVRPEISRAEKMAGKKEKRIKTIDEIVFFDSKHSFLNHLNDLKNMFKKHTFLLDELKEQL